MQSINIVYWIKQLDADPDAPEAAKISLSRQPSESSKDIDATPYAAYVKILLIGLYVNNWKQHFFRQAALLFWE